MLARIRFCLVVLILSGTVFSMEKASTTLIKMGPLLRFQGQKESYWHVSALYVVKSGLLDRHDKAFVFHDEHQTHDVAGQIIATKFDYDFVKFSWAVPQSAEEKKVFYRLVDENDEHYFVVPALGTAPKILFHSCNGYQTEQDKEAVHGIQPMWREVNRRHQKKSFHLQLAGGDQLYADGIIDAETGHFYASKVGEIYGVFALPGLQEWLSYKKNHDALNSMQFSRRMEEEVEKFYFNHYVKQYNESDFKEAMATIPSLSQPDDHDFFDGCGSYPDFLQNSLVMSGIRRIATWYCFIIQHQAQHGNFPQYALRPAMGYNFLHLLHGGKIAILGVDTRSERTRTQVVSEKTWNEIFRALDGITDKCEHLIVMLGIPIVFAQTKLGNLLTYSETHPTAERILRCVFAKNIFDLFELEDDLHDGWGHKDHKNERNWLINELRSFALRKKIRVTFLGGDVHVGGAGKIYDKEKNIDDDSPAAIYQIISSPIGNVSASESFAHILGGIAACPKKVSPSYKMHMIKLLRKDGKEKMIINRRNFVVLRFKSHGHIAVEWSAEPHPNKKNHHQPHRIYSLNIPCVDKKCDE